VHVCVCVCVCVCVRARVRVCVYWVCGVESAELVLRGGGSNRLCRLVSIWRHRSSLLFFFNRHHITSLPKSTHTHRGTSAIYSTQKHSNIIVKEYDDLTLAVYTAAGGRR
jgi:hypothetical protein